MDERLKVELDSFQSFWRGGYFEGDPLNPLTISEYGQLNIMSTMHATYLRCIKPYINGSTVSLEIGPGRGAWTKTLLPSREVYALDALPEDHNKFFQYLNYPTNVKYFQVKDFTCEMLPDNYFDFMFSFGCLCHVSFRGISEYAKSLLPKLKANSNCFWMVADYDKYNSAISHLSELSIWNCCLPKSRRHLLLNWLFLYLIKRKKLHVKPADKNDNPEPGRWYHAGVERTCSMLRQVGYTIVDPDVGTSIRDPILHFTKA